MRYTALKTSRRLVGGLALGATVLAAASLPTLARTTGVHAATTPTWVTTSGKIVHLSMIADYNTTNAGFNFDGAAHGQMTVTIPLGDTVDVTFTNKAQGAMHNVVVIAATSTLPASSTAPVFAGAASPMQQFQQGGPPQGASAAQKFSFVASKTGKYLLICGVAGHALAGMWDNLVVSPTAKAASVTFSTAETTTPSASVSPVNPNQWVSTSGKTVHLTLIAGYNKTNAGFNFDGGANGHMVVTVPLGDTIVGTYRSAVSIPHDVRIINYQKPLPPQTVALAFPGASAGGAGPGSSGALTFTFVASKTGTYMIMCGFPGHAIAGMWDTFVVSKTATVASITFK